MTGPRPDPASSASLRASIIVIGDEILGGFVQDTNSHWLAQRLQEQGVPLDRVHTVPDTLPDIDEALSAELARARPRLIVTTGGIGSTPDDLTMAGVATTLGVSLEVDAEIDRRITRALEWTADHGAQVTAEHEQSMRSMALVPEGHYLLEGATGLAPGVAVDVDGGVDGGGATIVILPGIPGEMKRITTGGIIPTLLQGRGRPQTVWETTHPYPESTLNPVFNRLVEDFPDVHLGSYPGPECIVRLKGEPDRVAKAAEVVSAYLEELSRDTGTARLRDAWAARWQD